jgi:hypothetical protein
LIGAGCSGDPAPRSNGAAAQDGAAGARGEAGGDDALDATSSGGGGSGADAQGDDSGAWVAEAGGDGTASVDGGAGGDGGLAGRCGSVQLGPTRATHDAILVDVDGDGRLDVVTAETDGHTAVFRQTAPRVFADPDVYPVGNLYEYAAAAADLNEDGVVDFAASDGYGSVGLLLSGDGGARAASTISVGKSNILQNIVLPDLDGDHHREIVVPLYESGTLGIWWATGPAAFQPEVERGVCNEPTQVAVIDANEDKKPDLVVGCYSGSSQLLLNNGDRTFTSSFFFSTSSTEALATGDVNGDGHVDVVVADRTFKQVIVLLGDGKGTFSQPTGLVASTQTEPVSAVLGDFDHDGKVDLVVGHLDDPRVFFYRGTGDGHFQDGQPMATPWTAINLGAGDVDRDGIDDLIVTDWGQGATVYFGPCP